MNYVKQINRITIWMDDSQNIATFVCKSPSKAVLEIFSSLAGATEWATNTKHYCTKNKNSGKAIVPSYRQSKRAFELLRNVLTESTCENEFDVDIYKLLLECKQLPEGYVSYWLDNENSIK